MNRHWNRRIDWANTLELVRLTAAVPTGGWVELARTTEDVAAVWQVAVIVQKASMNGGAAADLIVGLRLVCGNGRVTWIQDHTFTIPAADFAALDPQENRFMGTVQVPAGTLVALARFSCATVGSTCSATATVAPLGFPG